MILCKRFAVLITLATGLGLATSGAFVHAEDTVPPAPDWTIWLSDLKEEALAKGIPEDLFDRAFEGIEPNPRVIELDRRQPEFTLTYQQYIDGRLTDTRISRGISAMTQNREGLRAVAESYGVQPRFISAIWGLETNYGNFSGGMSVIRSLATLAHDPRRSDYFRNELLTALQILKEGHTQPESMLGSWAGAMGQSQFMPTSFNDLAVDYNGDGRRDIWETEVDVFASIGNYLSRYNWRDDMTWGRQVLLPDNFETVVEENDLMGATEGGACSRAMRQHTRALPLNEWNALGVRRLNGGELPDRDFAATLVQPGGPEGPAYLTYTNFRAILRYNCSNYYALSVGLLSDYLKGAE